MADKRTRTAWVREYRHNRGHYDSRTGYFTTSIKNAQLFDRRKDAEAAAGCIAVKVTVTIERFGHTNPKEE